MKISYLVYVTCVFCVTYVSAKEIRGIPNYFPPAFTRVGHTENFVAFSAGLTHNYNLNISSNITYDRVFLNLGKGYDPTTGVFTCPHAGTYAFFIHGLSQTTSQLNLDLYHNGGYIVSAFSHARQDYASAHQAAVLTLSEYDTVHIQGRGVNYMYGQPKEVYSTFSGVMVIPESSGIPGAGNPIAIG